MINRMGGKVKTCSQIADIIEPRVRACKGNYCEPFFGGGKVYFELWRRGIIYRAYLNDLDKEIANYWQVARDHWFEIAPFLAAAFNCYDNITFEPKNDLERALKTYALSFSSKPSSPYQRKYERHRSGILNPNFTKNVQYREYVEIAEMFLALQPTTVTCDDYEKHVDGVIYSGTGDDRDPGRNYFFYFDPPFFGTEHYYGDGTFDHARMRRVAEKTKRCAVSYNDCAEARKLYAGWDCRDLCYINSRHQPVTELLFLSSNCPEKIMLEDNVPSLLTMFGGKK